MKANRHRYGVIIATMFLAMDTAIADPSAAPHGYLEGKLTFSGRGVDIADDTSAPDVPSTSGEHRLVVRESSGKEVTDVTPDEKGHYRVLLPAGDYVLEFKERAKRQAGVRSAARKFTVTANEIVRVDMQVASDIRQMQ